MSLLYSCTLWLRVSSFSLLMASTEHDSSSVRKTNMFSGYQTSPLIASLCLFFFTAAPGASQPRWVTIIPGSSRPSSQQQRRPSLPLREQLTPHRPPRWTLLSPAVVCLTVRPQTPSPTSIDSLSSFLRAHARTHIQTDNMWQRSTAEKEAPIFGNHKGEGRSAPHPRTHYFSLCEDSMHQFHRLRHDSQPCWRAQKWYYI